MVNIGSTRLGSQTLGGTVVDTTSKRRSAPIIVTEAGGVPTPTRGKPLLSNSGKNTVTVGD